jgi:hypothetical protein
MNHNSGFGSKGQGFGQGFGTHQKQVGSFGFGSGSGFGAQQQQGGAKQVVWGKQVNAYSRPMC